MARIKLNVLLHHVHEIMNMYFNRGTFSHFQARDQFCLSLGNCGCFLVFLTLRLRGDVARMNREAPVRQGPLRRIPLKPKYCSMFSRHTEPVIVPLTLSRVQFSTLS